MSYHFLNLHENVNYVEVTEEVCRIMCVDKNVCYFLTTPQDISIIHSKVSIVIYPW